MTIVTISYQLHDSAFYVCHNAPARLAGSLKGKDREKARRIPDRRMRPIDQFRAWSWSPLWSTLRAAPRLRPRPSGTSWRDLLAHKPQHWAALPHLLNADIMNRAFFLILALCAALVGSPALAKGPIPADPGANQSTRQTAPDEGQLVEHGSYTNKFGKTVHSPAHSKSDEAPQGASAKCRDGTYSFSQHHSGTCSHHGGVADWVQ